MESRTFSLFQSVYFSGFKPCTMDRTEGFLSSWHADHVPAVGRRGGWVRYPGRSPASRAPSSPAAPSHPACQGTPRQGLGHCNPKRSKLDETEALSMGADPQPSDLISDLQSPSLLRRHVHTSLSSSWFIGAGNMQKGATYPSARRDRCVERPRPTKSGGRWRAVLFGVVQSLSNRGRTWRTSRSRCDSWSFRALPRTEAACALW